MITPFEAWPLTNAPMFASDLKHSATYKLRLRVVPADGTRRQPFRADWLAMPSWHLDRLFLVSVWGAAHPATAVGRFPNDTREALVARADAFFDASVDFIVKNRPEVLKGVRAIEVEIERQGPSRVTHKVGRYDLRSRSFTHLWTQP